MARPTLIAPEAIAERLASHPGWSLADGRLRRELEFSDFVEAFAFMTRVALVAERLDHHPDWHNVYRRVTIELRTHDVGGVTELDFRLAAAIDAAAGALGSADRPVR